MKKIHKIFIATFILVAVTPSVALASWWNPFTWKVFSKPKEVKVEKSVSIPQPSESSTSTIQTAITKETKEIPAIRITKPIAPKPSVSWDVLEKQYFAEATEKGQIRLTVCNSLGDCRYYYYSKELNNWVLSSSPEQREKAIIVIYDKTEIANNKINRNKDTQQPINNQPTTVSQSSSTQTTFERPLEAPSPSQLRRLMAICSLSDELAAQCSSQKFIGWYFTDKSFRFIMDDFVQRMEVKLAEQKAQNELSRQRYLLYLQAISQPIAPPSARYETYYMPVYSGGLKLEPSQLTSPVKWNIRWTGDGGGYIESSGQTTHFRCDSLLGKCSSD